MAISQEKTSIGHEGMTIIHEQTSIVHEGMAILGERRASGRQHSWPDWQRMARSWMTDGELTRDSEGGRERTQGTQRRSEHVSRRFSLGDYLGPCLGRCPGLS